jgi:hypothetical protein
MFIFEEYYFSFNKINSFAEEEAYICIHKFPPEIKHALNAYIFPNKIG